MKTEDKPLNTKGNFKNDQFASVSMDRKADYQISESVTEEGQVDVNWASDHLPAVEAGKKMNVKVNKISGKQKLRMKGKDKDIKKLLLSLGWTTSDLKRVLTKAVK